MLKKVSLVIASMLFLLGLFIFNRAPAFDVSSDYEVYFTSFSTSTSLKKIDKSDFKFVFGVKGESCKVDKTDFCLEEFLTKMNVTILMTENLSDVVCYYGYSPKVKYLEKINDKLINVHIAIGESYVKIGSPIIYGSF